MPPVRFRTANSVIAVGLLLSLVAAKAEPVRFIAFGDLQDSTPEGRAADRALIERINGEQPAFSVFIGDIKGGEDCTPALFQEVADIFAAHRAPLIYTPGDNEWTDCWRGKTFNDPLERKGEVIRLFTAKAKSIGAAPMPLHQQPGQRENAAWAAGGIHFATLHITGSNNNLRQDEAAIAEHLTRDERNLAWLEAAFERATGEGAAALVLVLHANPQWAANWWEPTGFDRFRASLAAGAKAFAKPILVVHGDTHSFRIDRPFKVAPNLIRLEVFGPPERGAVLVEADAADAAVFRFKPLPAP